LKPDGDGPLFPGLVGRGREKTQDGIETRWDRRRTDDVDGRGREKTQDGIETSVAMRSTSSSSRVEAGRKPRTGLKLYFDADGIQNEEVEAGRKPRTGLKQYESMVVELKLTSRQGENPGRD